MKPEKGKKKETPLQSPKKNEPSKGLNFISGLFFNLIGAGVTIVFIYIIFNNVTGYNWMYFTMLKGNLEAIENAPNLTFAQRYEAKWGQEIGLINKVKAQTPDSAIILIPPRKLLTQIGFKSTQELPWLTYFLYPRKVVYEDDKDSSKIYAQANYVFAVNGWGLDKLNYRPEKPEAFMVLPLRR